MEEWEALLQRRLMLLERISKMNHEIDKIDQRLDFLGKGVVSEQLDSYLLREQLIQKVS
jgi:hypothetical protein